MRQVCCKPSLKTHKLGIFKGERKIENQDVGKSSQREKKGGKSIAPAPLSGQKCKLCDYRAIKDAVMTAHIMKVHVNTREK